MSVFVLGIGMSLLPLGRAGSWISLYPPVPGPLSRGQGQGRARGAALPEAVVDTQEEGYKEILL